MIRNVAQNDHCPYFGTAPIAKLLKTLKTGIGATPIRKGAFLAPIFSLYVKRDMKDPNFDHIALCFRPDGEVNFYPETADPSRLAARLAKVVELLHQHPERIVCAAGACKERQCQGQA